MYCYAVNQIAKEVVLRRADAIVSRMARHTKSGPAPAFDPLGLMF